MIVIGIPQRFDCLEVHVSFSSESCYYRHVGMDYMLELHGCVALRDIRSCDKLSSWRKRKEDRALDLKNLKEEEIGKAERSWA